jgi:hypothetical protein
MIRLVVLLLLAVAIWMLLDWVYRKGARALGIDPDRKGPRPDRPTPPGRPEALVRCAACGAYVPASRALRLDTMRGTGAGDPRHACSEVCRHRLRTGSVG